MTDETPQSLAGIRKGSPVVISVHDRPLQRGVVGQLYPPTLVGVWVHGEPSPLGRTKCGTAEVINQEWLSLDLEDETGCTHAAWFVGARLDRGRLTALDEVILNAARRGILLPAGGVDRLRELVLMAAKEAT